jgi:PKD repeat protein
MKNTFTSFLTLFKPIGRLMLIGLIGLASLPAEVSAQYTQPNHYFGCSWNNTDYYGSIESIVIEDPFGNVVFNKAGDGCNQTITTTQTFQHYNLMSTTPSFTLEAGASYVFKVVVDNPNPQNVNVAAGVWFDFNGDQDFADAGEFVSPANRTFTRGEEFTFTFSVPCNTSSSPTRMRVRSDAANRTWTQNEHSLTNNTQVYYGETEDYTFDFSQPSSLNAVFNTTPADTAFLGTVVNLVNGNQRGYFLHEWDINDDGSIEYTSTNARHVFNSTGNFRITLKSENCLGRDSMTRSITVVEPTAPPVPDFVANKNKDVFIGIDDIELTDLSTNGPTYWEWFMYMKDDSANTRIDGDDLGFDMFTGNDPFYNKDPFFFLDEFMFMEGMYSVCMRAQNARGFSQWECKEDYIDVSSFPDVFMDASTFNTDRNPVTIPTGNLIDEGGRTGNYPNNKFSRALIIPCAAQEVSLTFSQLRLAANDVLTVYDGVDARGIPLHTGNGFSAGDNPQSVGTLVATSGAMYLEFVSNGSGNDSGWIATWTSKLGPKTPPVAGFMAPDTIFQGVDVNFENTTTNAIAADVWEWTVNGQVESNLMMYTDVFLNPGVPLNVCVEVTSCTGNDKYCQLIPIKAAGSRATNVDFEASSRRVNAGEEVQMTALTDNANRFKWTFFPQTLDYVNGTDNRSMNPVVRFSQAGPYTVSLEAWNYIDSAASVAKRIKDRYIIVVDYCNPIIGSAVINDVSISYFKLTDSDDMVLFENETSDELNAYTLYDNLPEQTLYFGSEYHVTMARPSSVNNMSRKVWIDWNIDGEFSANEEVAYEAPSTNDTFMATFTVPDLADAFEGRTKLRIGVSYANDPNEPCGAASSVRNANRIGEFEDYVVVLSNDGTMPTLTLNNEDTLFLEIGSTYTEYGATAIDPTEGDISNRIEIVDDIDMSLSGIYYVTYSVSDASGNEAPSVTRVVYVVKDQTPPVLTLNDADTIRLNVLVDQYNEPGATAIDAQDGDVTTAIITTGVVNTNVIGTYVVNYYVQDAQANGVSKDRVVIVEDVEAPVINNDDIEVINGENVVKVQLQSIFVDRTNVTDNYYNGVNATATDLMMMAGAAGEVDTRFKGSYPVTYTATDGSGNMATPLLINYIVEDYIAPQISLNTLDTVLHPVGSQYTSVQASVMDNLYGPSEISLRRTSNVNPFVLGLYTETYTATDASGNIAVKTRFVRVVDRSKPRISGLNGSVIKVGVGSSFDALERLIMTDNYDAPSVLRNNVEIMYNDINTYEEGWYSATFRTHDNSNNMSEPFTLLVHVSYDYGIVGVEEIAGLNLLNVYPNPSTGLINIKVDAPANEEVKVAVFDLMGSQVGQLETISGMNNSWTMNLGNYASGVYMVRAVVAGKVYDQKVVISH